jgi:hypothetical protein
MKALPFFFALILLFGCTKEVQIDIPGYEEQIVVDGQIELGGPPFILLSSTKDIYSPTDLQSYLNGFISGAIITVSNGTKTVQLQETCSNDLPPGSEVFAAELFGVPAEDLGNFQICGYTTFDTDLWGEVGKTYDLTVSYDGKTYTSSTTLEESVPFDSVYWKPDGKQTEYGFSWVTLSDPGNRSNAYFWEVKRINKNTEGNERDPLFTRVFAPVFDDEFFNGTTFDFGYENPMSFSDIDAPDAARGYYKVGDTVVIKFSSLDREVFDYFEKKYIQLSNGGSPFAVPANIPSNIKGGALGVWAGFSSHYDTLVCEN